MRRSPAEEIQCCTNFTWHSEEGVRDCSTQRFAAPTPSSSRNPVPVFGELSVELGGGAPPPRSWNDVIVPLVSRQLLRSENAGGSSSNAHIVDQNISADVLTVINDVVAFFGGPDLLAGLTNDQTFQASELGNLLRRFNSQLGSLPPGVGFVPSYDRGSAALVLRTAQ